jgi:hypothetical protein
MEENRKVYKTPNYDKGQRRAYYIKNKEQLLAYQKEYYQAHRDKYVEYTRNYWLNVTKPKRPVLYRRPRKPKLTDLPTPTLSISFM